MAFHQRALVVGLGAILSLTACVSHTPYQPYDEHGGYSDRRVDSETQVARFAGNTHTKAADASLFSQLRAVEVCQEQGYRFARILDVKDLTVSRAVHHSSAFDEAPVDNTVTASHDFGAHEMMPHTNYSGPYTGDHYGQALTWDESLTLPTFETVFSCTNLTEQASKASEVIDESCRRHELQKRQICGAQDARRPASK